MDHAPLNAVLESRRDLDDRHTIFTVTPDEPISFTAGQWTEMGLPRVEASEEGPTADEFVKDGVVRRAYSIASPPGSRSLQFYFNRVDEGQLTRWLWQLQPGERLYVDPEARGHFTLETVGPDTDLLMVATGTGVSPFVSMLQELTATSELGGHVALVHGTRHRALLGWEEMFREMSRFDHRFTYIPVLSREPDGSDWSGERGRVPDVLRDAKAFAKMAGLRLDPAHCRAYLCGNTGMIHTVEEILRPLGHQPRWLDPDGTIHTEIYY